jgi:hypothetical protein
MKLRPVFGYDLYAVVNTGAGESGELALKTVIAGVSPLSDMVSSPQGISKVICTQYLDK